MTNLTVTAFKDTEPYSEYAYCIQHFVTKILIYDVKDNIKQYSIYCILNLCFKSVFSVSLKGLLKIIALETCSTHNSLCWYISYIQTTIHFAGTSHTFPVSLKESKISLRRSCPLHNKQKKKNKNAKNKQTYNNKKQKKVHTCAYDKADYWF
jgi:hypothetical protein